MKVRISYFLLSVTVISIVVIACLAAVEPLLIPSVITPHLAYLVYVWVKEQIEREPLFMVFAVFCYGFAMASIIAIMLHAIIGYALAIYHLDQKTIRVLVVAPVVEELTKFSGVCLISRNRRIFNEVDDGIVYGASAGLGFSALETALYALRAREFVVIALVRDLSCTASHAASSALAGLGLSLSIFKRNLRALPLLLLGAMVLHSVHNLLAMHAPRTVGLMIFVDLFLFLLIVGRVK